MFSNGCGQGLGCKKLLVFQLKLIWMISSEPVVTKSGVVIHYQKPECHAQKWVAIFKFKVRAYQIKIWLLLLLSSELIILLQPNLVWQIIKSQNVKATRLIIKYDSFYDIFWILDPFATKLCSMVCRQYMIISQSVLWKDFFAMFKSRPQWWLIFVVGHLSGRYFLNSLTFSSQT